MIGNTLHNSSYLPIAAKHPIVIVPMASTRAIGAVYKTLPIRQSRLTTSKPMGSRLKLFTRSQINPTITKSQPKDYDLSYDQLSI